MKNIIYILLALTLASCANEKNFVKFHDKDNGASAKHCGIWYPVKEKITTDTFYKEGEVQILPGITEIVQVDCDSATKALKGKPNVVYVTAPGKVRVDTIRVKEMHEIENTATVEYLKDALSKASAKQSLTDKRLSEIKGTRNKLWGVLSILAVIIAVYIYFKAKASILKRG